MENKQVKKVLNALLVAFNMEDYNCKILGYSFYGSNVTEIKAESSAYYIDFKLIDFKKWEKDQYKK